MIKEVLDMLHTTDYYNVSKNVEIAKGKKKYITTWKESKEKFKRAWRLRK